MDTDANDVRVVLITAPDIETANKLARAALEAKAAACVNIIPGIQSLYWWDERIEQSGELLLIVKTTASAFDRLREIVAKNHPYDCPEILAISATEGAPAYLSWLRSSVRG
jgi:periplasmic divalent cation tolerance protein